MKTKDNFITVVKKNGNASWLALISKDECPRIQKLKYRGKPVDINLTTWCYVERHKVIVVHEVRDNDGTYNRTVQIKIPFRIIKKWFLLEKDCRPSYGEQCGD